VVGTAPPPSFARSFAASRSISRIKTALLEWAYARLYRHSDERRRALAQWLHHYNWHRPHTSLGGRPPVTRVLTATNLVRLHS